jgi:hypothetical protein
LEKLNNDIFIDEEHKKVFHFFIKKDKINLDDRERLSLFYILAFHDKFRENINQFYDFENRGIKSDVIDNLMFSDAEKALIRLGFHLFTGSNKYKATIKNTFWSPSGDFETVAINSILIWLNRQDILKQNSKGWK